MTTYILKNAPEATNSKALTTNIYSANFRKSGSPSKAIAQSAPLAPDTTDLSDMTALLIELREFTTKDRKSIYATLEMEKREYLVHTDDMTVYCEDLKTARAFIQIFGGKK